MKRFKKSKCIIIVFIVCLCFASCTKIEPVSNVEVKKDELIVTGSIPNTLNTEDILNPRDNDIICAMFEGLVESTDGGVIAPALSQGWKINEDGNKYTFLLRDNIFWSDGEAITANDFVEYFSYLFSSENESYTNNELYSIYGLEEYKKGIKSFDEVGIFADNEKEITINLNSKDDKFLEKLSKADYRLRDTDDVLADYKNKYKEIRYTGAYVISLVEEDSLTIEKNKQYNLKSTGAEKIKIINSNDNIQDFARLNTNKIDIVNNPPISALKESSYLYQIYGTDSARLQYMVLNSKRGLGQYLDFRKGIYTSLHSGIMQNYLLKNNFATPDVREITLDEIEEEVFYKSENERKYDEQARQLEIETSKNFFNAIEEIKTQKILIVGEESFENKNLSEFIQKDLEIYGIQSEVKLYKRADLDKKLESGEFDILIDKIDLNTENIKTKTEKISEFYKSYEYSILSLYVENDFWCKSENLKNIYIDDNGNLIFKKMVYLEQ